MATTASVNRPPPAQPGPNVGNLPSYSGLPNPGQQHPGLNGTGQDPGPPLHPQHHVSSQPIFYVPAPPPAPFLQYQWPVPFPYNPFAGFPGMGYGMVMPPPPPPPYMEAPAYILPHPHIQPVDYRRLLHPQVQVPNAPYQNPNQPRRIRQPCTVPRETVNSAVQTEPTHGGMGGYSDGNPYIRSDSGHGTASLSPSSSSCSSQKQGSVEVENYGLPTCNAKDVQVNGTSTNGTVRHDSNNHRPKGTKAVQSCIQAPAEPQKCHTDSVGQENVPLFRKGHCNMWSVSSPDSMVPVCSSSQQEDEVVKERHASVPDILMSWGGSTPQSVVLKIANKGLHQNDQQLPSYETQVETEKSLYHSPTEPKNGPVVADVTKGGDDADNVLNCKHSETLFKIVKLPFALHDLPSSRRESELVGSFGSVTQCLTYKDEMLHSPDTSQMLPDNEQENGKGSNPHEDTTEINPYQMSSNSNQMRRMNESVWSVESLVPFIPAKDWMLQKGTFEPEIIIEMTEEAENGGLSTQSDNLIVKSSKRRLSHRFSFSDAGPMSDSWLIYSTPAEKLSSSKKTEIQCEIDVSADGGPQQCLSAAPSEKDPLVSPTALRSKIIVSIPTEEDVDENGSSEPEANRSPNQESVIEQQEKSPCSPEQEHALLLNPVAGDLEPSDQLILQNGVDMEVEKGTCRNEVSQLRDEQLCVLITDQRMAKVSLSKGHLVESGVQCTNLQDCKTCKQPVCHMEPDKRPPFKNPDTKRANGGKAEGFGMNGHGHKNHRRQGPYRNRGQENPSGQQESSYGYNSRPGKSRGGNGRNQRYDR